MTEDDKKHELEKLVDWELNKQLAWAVVLLSATLGIAGTLFVDSISTTTRVFVVFLGLTLMAVLDMSFYRLATSLVALRRYIEQIGKFSKLYEEELVTNAIFKRLYGWFVDTTKKYEPHLRIWSVRSIIALADIFIVSYVCLILLRIFGYSYIS